MQIKDKDLGRIEVKTLALPDYVKPASATYTVSGTVLVSYRRDDDPEVKDYMHIAIVNDDGTDFKDIFAGVIEEHPRANGTRFMVFADNKRVLLGDYVLECDPDIDNCRNCELITVEYPWNIKNDARVFKHWSEIIIAPDNEHICWTLLFGKEGAATMIGVLVRKEKHYVIEKIQMIHSFENFKKDAENEGFLIPQTLRGGEVKQFVHGGAAISLVGVKDSSLTDSVVQDLLSDEIKQITKNPGYEETTIFSPDEKLGIVMSTRFSPKTNLAVLGLLPRPYSYLVMMRIINFAYMYSVAAVRSYRGGNIGPVLIDIEKSVNEPDYMGVNLSDPEGNWVYYSPMSWHPAGKKAMWPEGLRGTKNKRIRIAELLDYKPGVPIPSGKTPDNIPYGVSDANLLWDTPNRSTEGKIAGKHSGYIHFTENTGSVQSEYIDMTNDGKLFYNGYEASGKNDMGETVYEAELAMSGEKQGEMKLRLTFSPMSLDGATLPNLLFDTAEDGKSKSFGYAECNGVRLNIEDMAE